MRRNGFEVEPTYDSKGVCRGYSVGEKLYDLDGNYSSTVMYKASAGGFGHGRDLTVSKLFGTWQKQHPEMEEARTKSYRWKDHEIMGSVPMIIHAPIVTLLNELIEIIMPFNPIHTSECFAYLRIIFSCKDTNIFSFSQIFSEEIDQEHLVH